MASLDPRIEERERKGSRLETAATSVEFSFCGFGQVTHRASVKGSHLPQVFTRQSGSSRETDNYLIDSRGVYTVKLAEEMSVK